jgi:exosortase/archaeosortase family protein
MTSATTDVGPQQRFPASAARVAATGMLVGLIVFITTRQVLYRGWEARIAGLIAGPVTGTPTSAVPETATFYLHSGQADMFGLRITPECSSAIVTSVLVGITALLTATTRLRISRLARAAVAAIVAFWALNLGRMTIIAYSTNEWGRGAGFHWSHVWAGTAVTVVGGCAAFMTYLAVLGRGRDTVEEQRR